MGAAEKGNTTATRSGKEVPIERMGNRDNNVMTAFYASQKPPGTALERIAGSRMSVAIQKV